MREFAAMIGMLLAAVVGMVVMAGAVTGYWAGPIRFGLYGALAIAAAGVVYAAGYACAVRLTRTVVRLLDRRANK